MMNRLFSSARAATVSRSANNQASVALAMRFFSSAAAEEKKFEFKNPFKVHLLEKGPENWATMSKADALKYYRLLTLYRRVEVNADNLYKQRHIKGFCHLYDGQEAFTVGMEAALTFNDSIITAYRDHTTQLGRGDSVVSVMGELMGKAVGCSKGKGGSMHMYYEKNRFYGGNGIVGAQVPVGAGLAFAHKFKKDGGVSVAMFGDGAANQGQIFEAANMAALWKLPVIFFCENNKYGMGTSISRASADTRYYMRGHYVPGLWIDGMDVLAVKRGMEFAAAYCRAGNGPLFVECETYRYHGHSMSDPGIAYRSKDEVTQTRQERDCIELMRRRIVDETGWATEKDLKEIQKEVKAEVDQATDEALKASQPDVKELLNDIYSEAPPPFIRAVEFEKSIRNAA